MISRTAIAAVVASLVLLSPFARGDEPKFSAGEFQRLLKELNLHQQPWATIPWKNTLPEARVQAAKEHKPIFMVVNTGNCLGFV